ncbi:MAG: choice-of-anchor Q domain-containing protein [Polyangiales bacterium]
MRSKLVTACTSLLVACSSSAVVATNDATTDAATDAAMGDGNTLDAPAPDAIASDTPHVEVGPAPTTCTATVAAADVSHPTTVVGTGTASSCTEALLSAAIVTGGVVTFSCGTAPVTITLTATLSPPTDKDTTIDGGGLLTIDGGGAVRILDWNSANYRADAHVLTLQHLTLTRGKATGTKSYPTEPAPCSQGFYDGSGGALHMRDGVLHAIDVKFLDNHAAALGPDVGGGAVYIEGCKSGAFVGCTFDGNSASNAGAIGALNSDFDVFDSTFTNNTALGNGANGDDATKCSVVDPVTKQHQTGSGGNGGAIAIDGGSDGTHTFCGAVFANNTGGTGALGGAIFRTPDGAQMKTVIDRCTFDGNHGDAAGAGYFHNSDLEITASTFSNNVASGAGAIQSDGSVLTLTNVTFSGNHATTSPGGTLSLFGVTGALLNCTFASNACDAANMFGAAIFGSPKLTIDSTIFDGDTATNPGAPMQCQVDASTSGASDLQWPKTKTNGGADDAACVSGVTFADAKLGALGDHTGPVKTMVPAAGSPALGAGTKCAATDARGKTRPATGCTAGAVEGSE